MVLNKRAGRMGLIASFALGMMLSTTAAFGALMDVGNAPGYELEVDEILELVTGQALAVDGAERIDDALDSTFVQGLTAVTYICSMWGQGAATEGTMAHTFSYSLDGGADVELFNTVDEDPNDQVAIAVDRAAGNVIRFSSDNVKYTPASSDAAFGNMAMANGVLDRVLTFNVTAYEADLEGLNGSGITTEDNGNNLYLLFFDTGRDGDYNDLVVLVEDDAGPNPGPEPPTPTTGAMLGLGAIAMLRRRIKK